MRRALTALAMAMAGSGAIAPAALAQALLTPPVATESLQEFALSIPNEQSGARTVEVTMTVPPGFTIDSFERAAGWSRRVALSGSGDHTAVSSVTWSTGVDPTGQDAVFRFHASAVAGRTYALPVRQRYSDGTVVDWDGSGSSATPAPTVFAVSSAGGGSRSTLAITALVVGSLGVVVGVLAFTAGRRTA
jgi:uncharacterized protein YcnI